MTRTFIIFSSARSGSTWLGKIFDSRPDVFYLHEPEIVDRGMDLLPFWFDQEPTAVHIEAAKTYLARLLSIRSPRAVGSWPFFKKDYRSRAAEISRRALILTAKSSERIGLSRFSDRLRIPDLADRGPPAITVIKSVSALGRAEVLVKGTNGAIRPLLLIRHPCGYVGSMLRGDESRNLKPVGDLGRLLETRTAQRLGIDRAAFSLNDPVARLAWNWLLSNAEAYPAIHAAGGEIVVYETLANDAKACTAALFERLGLNWIGATETFLARSAASEGAYYSIYRNPTDAAARWRKELGNSVVSQVKAIVTRDPLGQMFF